MITHIIEAIVCLVIGAAIGNDKSRAQIVKLLNRAAKYADKKTAGKPKEVKEQEDKKDIPKGY